MSNLGKPFSVLGETKKDLVQTVGHMLRLLDRLEYHVMDLSAQVRNLPRTPSKEATMTNPRPETSSRHVPTPVAQPKPTAVKEPSKPAKQRIQESRSKHGKDNREEKHKRKPSPEIAESEESFEIAYPTTAADRKRKSALGNSANKRIASQQNSE